jgi:hypothetical protein
MDCQDIIQTGIHTITVEANHYGVGNTPLIKYKTGNSPENCDADEWNIYSSPFISEGYVMLRIEYI